MRLKKQPMTTASGLRPSLRRGQAAKVQTLLLLPVVFVLGAGAGAYLIYRSTHTQDATSQSQPARIQLSENTRAVLQDLKSPVEIRFYSKLGDSDGTGAADAFAGRVDQLLSEYEREAGGKLKITRHNSRSDSDKAAATADGFATFNQDQSQGSFLALAVAQGEQKEALAPLAPEWENALEPDLTRAILRVTSAHSIATHAGANAQAEAAVAEEVKRSIPNFAEVTVEQGRQLLRDTTLQELKAAASEMQAQVQAAQQRLSEAQTNKSEAGQEAAMKELQEIQSAQTQKIKEITARFQAQAAALQRLKAKP
jgi:hypothetical protein